MTRDILSIYRAGLLTTLDIEFGDEPVHCIKRDEFLFEKDKISQFLGIFIFTADEYNDLYIGF